jgi:hypothetical protein
METVKIDGVVYAVEKVDRCEELTYLRADMDRRGVDAVLTVRRPKGRKTSLAYRYTNGQVRIVATV